MSGFQIRLKLRVGYFVGRLVAAVIFASFLNRIVRQMDELIGEVRICELLLARAEVAPTVDVSFNASVCGLDKSIGAYVEFASIKKQRVRHVTLDDQTAVNCHGVEKVLHMSVDLASVVVDVYLLTLAKVLTRLEDPRFSVKAVGGQSVPLLVGYDVRLRHGLAKPSLAHVLVQKAFVPDLSIVHYVVVEDSSAPKHALQRTRCPNKSGEVCLLKDLLY